MNGLKTRMAIGTTKKKLILIRNGNYGKAVVKTRPKHLMLLQKTWYKEPVTYCKNMDWNKLNEKAQTLNPDCTLVKD